MSSVAHPLDKINFNICGICQNKLSDCCIECEILQAQQCLLATGTCGHIYHHHCIKKWNERGRITCPLDDEEWIINTKETPINNPQVK